MAVEYTDDWILFSLNRMPTGLQLSAGSWILSDVWSRPLTSQKDRVDAFWTRFEIVR